MIFEFSRPTSVPFRIPKQTFPMDCHSKVILYNWSRSTWKSKENKLIAVEVEDMELLPILSCNLPLVFQTLLCFFHHWKSSRPMAWNIFSHHVSFWLASALSSRAEAYHHPWLLLAVFQLVLYSTTKTVPHELKNHCVFPKFSWERKI